MSEILQLQGRNCKNCYKCIRHCPVKSIRFADHQANILPEECIYCGQCTVACPQNAKQVRNDVAAVEALIGSGRPVYASIAPSFIADFAVTGLEGLVLDALKTLGFAGAGETAEGARMVKSEYERLLDSGEAPLLISSCCHSVNLLIEKYYPQALPYLAKVITPMNAHALSLKEQFPGAAVVFIGPCVSKKAEAEAFGAVDFVLTFEELREWLERKGIPLPATRGLDGSGKRSRFFPSAGGIIKSMATRPDYSYLVVDGMEACMDALAEIEGGGLRNCFIEMSACKGSCIGGPAMGRNRSRPLHSMARVEGYAGAAGEDFDTPAPGDLHRTHHFVGRGRQLPGESAILETLQKMGKLTKDQELNCGSCGYPTCREKAIAVIEGKADLSMCLPYLKERAESFSDTIIGNTPNAIIVMDEKLTIQQLNRAAGELFGIGDYKSLVGSAVSKVLGPIEYLQVMESDANGASVSKHYLAEYDKFVEESIIFDKDYQVVISIMRDITAEEKERRARAAIHQKNAEITDKVIEKQMRVVQEIASLLGETTAETKIALTKLKETLE